MKRSLLPLLVVGCTVHRPEISPDVSTRDIRVAVHLDTPGSVFASLTGPGGNVILLPPDRASFAQGDKEWPAVHVANGYVATIGDTTGLVSFRLTREADESVDQPFVIPPPFSVKAPAAMSRGVGMTFTWDGQIANAAVAFSLDGSCIVPLGRVLGTDTGTYSLNAAELRSAGMLPGACDVTLTVTRTYDGAEPSTSTLEGFQASFVVSSTATFVSSP
jgi:hypothetical protein